MAVLEDGVADGDVVESEVVPSFVTRQQERNRKKKLKKKASKQRKRADRASQDAQASVSAISSSESVSETRERAEEIPRKEYPVFELTGPFERFKVCDFLVSGILCPPFRKIMRKCSITCHH